MKKNFTINSHNHSINLITNGQDDFNQIVLCFHGFNGDKWGDAYSGLKKILEKSLVCSFDSCGHGESVVKAEDMRLDIILQEIDDVVCYLKNLFPDKPISLVSVSYGAYRVMNYLLKYKPQINKLVFVNPAFRMLETLEFTKEFNYKKLKENEFVSMKRSLNKFMSKAFLDDLYNNNLYSNPEILNYNGLVVIGTKDRLIKREDILEIQQKHNYKVCYVDDDHCFENKENWNVVKNYLEG